jgi:aromatic ring hydroxylase
MNKINKGYTLTVTSWENDGDNYRTKSKTVQTLEEAKVWNEMMQMCTSKNTSEEVKLGNTYDGYDEKQEQLILDFIKKHHNTFNISQKDLEDLEDTYDFIELFSDLSCELLGGSEDYMCRVMESCIVTYSPVDVIPEIIEL